MDQAHGAVGLYRDLGYCMGSHTIGRSNGGLTFLEVLFSLTHEHRAHPIVPGYY